ncbi:SigB/SigF/SigG family RNA polymerase sigma factor [Streptomyces diastatochromogenes]|uniref:RNA polymerase subunit sigma n=1 Tax=Streptomyces diastatochromogenes TaxID=42236 RepID=A0A233RRD4_STRDA|nr:SigB/SigF/SigG family RNA polymerase sigma factor [Streptomyces diastatochromogenes]OXY85946.1 RNA polymerase subunit sigma [Streptomyces diastatochromogenes]
MSVTRVQHSHDDAPDTMADFRRLHTLPKGPQRDGLRDELVRAWLPMAHRIATRYRGRGEPLEDLRQVAALALIKAVDRFDPERGGAFESYAVPTITGEVRKHFRDHTWALQVPRRTQELRRRVAAVYQELARSGGEISAAEIAARTHLPTEDVREGLSARHAYAALSLDVELVPGGPSEGNTLADALGVPDPSLDTVVDRESVRPLIGALSERDRRILYLRFFRGMTQRCIAEEYGISQMHVSRILNRICSQLRDQVLADAA